MTILDLRLSVPCYIPYAYPWTVQWITGTLHVYVLDAIQPQMGNVFKRIGQACVVVDTLQRTILLNTSEEDIGICMWWDNGASMPKKFHPNKF